MKRARGGRGSSEDGDADGLENDPVSGHSDPVGPVLLADDVESQQYHTTGIPPVGQLDKVRFD